MYIVCRFKNLAYCVANAIKIPHNQYYVVDKLLKFNTYSFFCSIKSLLYKSNFFTARLIDQWGVIFVNIGLLKCGVFYVIRAILLNMYKNLVEALTYWYFDVIMPTYVLYVIYL